MTKSHKTSTKPSLLLAVICLAVAFRLRPDWVAVKLGDAALESGISAERLSRLCSRVIAPCETLVATLSRIGRPAGDNTAAAKTVAERDLLAALLDVATSLLTRLELQGAWRRPLVIGAWRRLKKAHPSLTQKRFTAALALSERTFRHWLATQQPAAEKRERPQPSTTKPKPKKRPLRRGRFSFAVTLPGTQLAADTTDLCAFGQPLKLIAAQDIGGRDLNLFDSVIVDDHESAELVVHVLTEALATQPGEQVITDQGTPYMAELTRATLEQLGADHAPQREGDPLGKATIERAFGTVKHIAGPLFALTNTIATAIPSLHNGALAKAVTTIVLLALLKSYQAGARATRRACQERAGLSSEELATAAKQSREHAHAEEKSARLLLTHIHHIYDIGGSQASFIRTFRRFPLLVLQRAERAFATQVHRDDIRNRRSYFAAIVSRLHDAYRIEHATAKRQRENMQALYQGVEHHTATRERWAADPQQQLESALAALSAQWHAPTAQLLFSGAGLGSAWLKDALSRLVAMHGSIVAEDMAYGIFKAFAAHHADLLGPLGTSAIEDLLNQQLQLLHRKPPPTHDCAAHCVGDILKKTGPPQRPPPSSPLRT